MISYELTKAIETEGKKNNFYIFSAGGEKDENGEFVFIIKLKRKVPETLNISVTERIKSKEKFGQ